ncbi:MAG: cupin domain-containing protein [Ardenticatenaceae bacterium]|nr:cupin domain-containing protein [Ardenticatenaceae bacterium]
MTAYTHLADLTHQINDIPPDSIISRTIFSGDGLKAILFGFAPGQELSEHTAAKPAVLHFVKGQARLTLGDETMAAQPGTWVHMEPHLAHSVFAETELIMLLLLLDKA